MRRVIHTGALVLFSVGTIFSLWGQPADERLRFELERIHELDKRDRINLGICKNSVERDSVLAHMQWQDSLNLARVTYIIDSAGWLGPDVVAGSGRALWTVIQHADLVTQEKYLPVMQRAVVEGRADPGDLAYLEDRVNMRRGRPQVYGTQYISEEGCNQFWIIEDEYNVNDRRSAVGLGPLEIYARDCGILWVPPIR